MLSKIREWTNQWLGVKPLAQTTAELEGWLTGALGKAILAEQKPLIDAALRDLYGFHLMQLAISRDLDLTKASTIHHRFSFSSSLPNGTLSEDNSLSVCLADVERVPLDSESIDVALLHHVLEYTQNPHNLLRDVARTIIPRGHIVIVGFNPLSWYGLFKQFGTLFTGKTHWRHHSLRLGRVLDWLKLLDFEAVSIKQGFYRWPIDHPRVMEKTQWYERFAKASRLPMGGFYIIVARKDIVGMTPIKPGWKKFNPIESLVAARPTSRVGEPARAVDTAGVVKSIPVKKQLH